MGEMPIELKLEAPGLKGFLDHVKGVDPTLARDLRRELRSSGDDIIAEQRAILRGPRPGSIRKTGQKLKLIVPSDGGRPYIAKRNVFEYGSASSRASTGMREQIADGLHTRVTTGARRQSITVRTNSAKAPLSRVWEKKRFRAPNFGSRTAWHDQRGQPYFWLPVKGGYERVQQRVADAIDRVLRELAKS